MWGISFYRAVKSGIKNFFRNGWLSIATTSVIALTLFIISLLLGLIFVSNQIINEIENKINISVYFKPEVVEEKIMEVRQKLQSKPEVKEVYYTSREDALAVLKTKYENNEIIMESLRELNENPLEASLSVKVYDSNKYESLENELIAGEHKELISKTDYSDHQKEIDRLNTIITVVRKSGIFIVSLLMVIAVLVTFNSIRLTMYTHRAEIEIMRLVGAGNWFIRIPFITEGILYGIFAALIVVASWYPLAGYLAPFFSGAGTQINPIIFLNTYIVQSLTFVLFTGMFLGAVSSFLAIRKYLKA